MINSFEFKIPYFKNVVFERPKQNRRGSRTTYNKMKKHIVLITCYVKIYVERKLRELDKRKEVDMIVLFISSHCKLNNWLL